MDVDILQVDLFIFIMIILIVGNNFSDHLT